MRFTYVEPRLMPLWLRFFPVSQAPSLLAHMPLSEFAMRSQRACPLPPIVYPSAAPATRQQGPQEACSSKPQQQHHVSADARQLHASDRAGQRAMADAPPDGAPQDGRSLESRGAAGGGNGEFCYMQSPLVPRLAQDCDLQAAPFSLVQGPGELQLSRPCHLPIREAYICHSADVAAPLARLLHAAPPHATVPHVALHRQ